MSEPGGDPAFHEAAQDRSWSAWIQRLGIPRPTFLALKGLRRPSRLLWCGVCALSGHD